MRASIEVNNKTIQVDLSAPIDISIPIKDGQENPNAWWAPFPQFDPYRAGNWVASTAEGSPVNSFNIKLNPHGNGTHTECIGHIAKEKYTINKALKSFHHLAELVSIYPEKLDNGDLVISRSLIEDALSEDVSSLIIRTLPNDDSKLRRLWSDTNPPYIDEQALAWLNEKGINHLLIDLPSVDRESDEGKLAGHKAFWSYPESPRTEATISEMIYVPAEVKDGLYFLQFQVLNIDLDVSPSRPVLYEIL